ncbi:MAG: PAS domain S-box protein [Gammaproteobacteria bacterium]|nr:PAS domain S-box protein [Gammaproteobacteria bacterium]
MTNSTDHNDETLSQQVQAMESASDGVVYVFADTRRLADCTTRFARMLGYTRKEIPRLGITDIHPPEAHALVFEQLDRMRRGDANFVGNIPVLRKDRSVFYADISASSLVVRSTKYLVSFFRDVSSRLQTEAALRDERARLHAILTTTVDGMITIDELGIIESFNPAAEKLFGYTASEVVGHSVNLLMPEPYHGAHDGYLQNYRSTGTQRIIGIGREVNGRRKDGSIFPMDLGVSEIRIGNARLFSAIVHDISRRKAIEADLVNAKENAEKASLAKSEFLNSMSHELRTPLNAILGFSQLLESDPKPLTGEQREFVQYISKSGHVLLELINEILDLARIEAGRLVLSIEPVLIDEVLETAAGMLGPELKTKPLTLNLNSDGAPGQVVAVDHLRFHQVILNLLTNAAKYNRRGGSITVRCFPPDGGMTRVSVQDTGIGIPYDKQSLMFQAFERLGRENGIIPGSGIGLVITRRLTEMMQGRIGFSSEPNTGSTFWVEFPSAALRAGAERTAAAVRPPAIDVAERNDPIKVLYIEDNPANLRFMERLISKIPNTQMLGAPDPKLGLELAHEHRPDVILLDINLPGMDGYEVLRCLRNDEATCRIPVIAVTANAMPRDIYRGNQAGFKGYVTKPINVPQFIALFNATVQGMEKAVAHPSPPCQ